MPTKLAPNLTMGNMTDVLGSIHLQMGDEIPKRGETTPVVWSRSSTQKGVYSCNF